MAAAAKHARQEEALRRRGARAIVEEGYASVEARPTCSGAQENGVVSTPAASVWPSWPMRSPWRCSASQAPWRRARACPCRCCPEGRVPADPDDWEGSSTHLLQQVPRRFDVLDKDGALDFVYDGRLRAVRWRKPKFKVRSQHARQGAPLFLGARPDFKSSSQHEASASSATRSLRPRRALSTSRSDLWRSPPARAWRRSSRAWASTSWFRAGRP